MPRALKTKSKATADKRLQQKSLFDFAGGSNTAKPAASSSRAAMPSKSSPIRPRNTPMKRKRRRAASVDSDEQGSSSDVAAIHFEPRPPIELSDSDDERPPRRLHKKKEINVSSSADYNARDSDSDMDDVPSPRKKRLVKRSTVTTLSDSSDNEEHEPAPKRRKLAKGKRPTVSELSDDSGDEVDEAQILESRLRKRGKKSSFQKNLEKLKKRRGGQTAETSSEEEEEESEGEDKDEEDEPVPFFGARRDGTEDIEEEGTSHQSREDEDDFIVEDDAATTNLPAEFSMAARQDPAHLFKIVCQLFVHLAVRPARERHNYMQQILKGDGQNEEYFAVPLVMTRNKLSGLRDSVASSVWRPGLKKALLALPDFTLSHLDFAVPHCDACHLGGRMSTFLGRASGQPYDRDSFEPIKKSSDDEESSGDDDEDEDADEVKEFNLGRFCAARVQVFHRFSHWEYTLFEAIKSELDHLRGGGNFVRVGFWKGLQPPEDLADADGVMDWLDQRGFIQMEWQRIKDMMSSASRLEGGREDDQDLDLS
ncbi:unnamed protein product [Peniophora sp. CBMAI 1063]|nr:unnamed protein product [Peniophora sp. CBMAI 1063]